MAKMEGAHQDDTQGEQTDFVELPGYDRSGNHRFVLR